MRPDRVSNPGPLALESDALPTALHDPADPLEARMNRWKMDGWMDGWVGRWVGGGWMTCDVTSFYNRFQSYQDDGWIIIKGCVQWNPVYD